MSNRRIYRRPGGDKRPLLTVCQPRRSCSAIVVTLQVDNHLEETKEEKIYTADDRLVLALSDSVVRNISHSAQIPIVAGKHTNHETFFFGPEGVLYRYNAYEPSQAITMARELSKYPGAMIRSFQTRDDSEKDPTREKVVVRWFQTYLSLGENLYSYQVVRGRDIGYEDARFVMIRTRLSTVGNYLVNILRDPAEIAHYLKGESGGSVYIRQTERSGYQKIDNLKIDESLISEIRSTYHSDTRMGVANPLSAEARALHSIINHDAYFYQPNTSFLQRFRLSYAGDNQVVGKVFEIYPPNYFIQPSSDNSYESIRQEEVKGLYDGTVDRKANPDKPFVLTLQNNISAKTRIPSFYVH